MKLNLVGHEYKYAVEQIMLALFPTERPEYESAQPSLCELPNNNTNKNQIALPNPHQSLPIAPSSNINSQLVEADRMAATSRLSYGGTYAQATTELLCLGRLWRGTARIKQAKLTDKLTSDRLLQRIIKQSFFRAAEKTLASPPPWGSLTGIRPAKIIEPMLESGTSENAAMRTLMREYYVSPERALLCAEAARSAISLKRTLKPRDIALYLGIPFCPTRCTYCSFVSNSVEKSFDLIEPYVETLQHEIQTMSQTAQELGLRISAIYTGGGTPTSLPAEALEAIMLSLKASFDLSHQKEYTVEAGRPDTITEEKLRLIKRLGAKRVCINPQSMSEKALIAIGRKHTPKDIIDAVRLAQSIGLAINMDIIAGLPTDSPEGFRNTLDALMHLRPENITVHTLSLKKGSRIMLEGTPMPCDANVAEMLEHASRVLREYDYSPYYLYRQKYTSGGFENVGWSLPGFEGIYNTLMMDDLCTVFALGGGGATKLVLPNGRIERIFNAKFPREYIMQTGKITEKALRITHEYHRLLPTLDTADATY